VSGQEKLVVYFFVGAVSDKSRLELKAQREAILNYVVDGQREVIAEFTEHEIEDSSARPELKKALATCKTHRAKLIVAKQDLLPRSLAFAVAEILFCVEYIAVDNQHTHNSTARILAAAAEYWR
jgi:DNA invertase Pin-like site-specific DNA recombinase